MTDEEIKDRIKYIFGYDNKYHAKIFNRPPEYITIQDITKKHSVGKSYHAIEKQLLDLIKEEIRRK